MWCDFYCLCLVFRSCVDCSLLFVAPVVSCSRVLILFLLSVIFRFVCEIKRSSVSAIFDCGYDYVCFIEIEAVSFSVN